MIFLLFICWGGEGGVNYFFCELFTWYFMSFRADLKFSDHVNLLDWLIYLCILAKLINVLGITTFASFLILMSDLRLYFETYIFKF